MWLAPSLVLVGYLLGSVSPALIAARRAGVDLYAEGSGNPGATNVGRVLGKRTGRVVLVLDVLKGLLPTLAVIGLGLGWAWVGAVGFSATLGHCYPIWHRFRGGKGAATAAGAMLASVPLAGAIAIVAYVALKRISRRASVGSLAGACAGALVASLVAPHPALVWMAWGIAALVFLRHHDNVARLWRGTEPES